MYDLLNNPSVEVNKITPIRDEMIFGKLAQ